MSFNGLAVLGLLGSAGAAAQPGVPAGDYPTPYGLFMGPDRVQTGKNLLAEDGSFAYSGDDGTQYPGSIHGRAARCGVSEDDAPYRPVGG